MSLKKVLVCPACCDSNECSVCEGAGSFGEDECIECNGTGECQKCKPNPNLIGWVGLLQKHSKGVIFH